MSAKAPRVSTLNPDVLTVVHCYSGDRQQVIDLLDVYEHHDTEVVIISPVDSPVHNIRHHDTRVAGEVAYIGQKSWDRQHAQLELLLEYPCKWYLLNDSDSFILTPKLPAYLFADENIVYSNQVHDFRVDDPRWGPTFHAPLPPIAMQPPYFLSRKALEKIVKASKGLEACPVCPFIDWWWVPACYAAGVKHAPYQFCASCETVTPNGIAVMSQCISELGAEAIHAIKRKEIKELMLHLHRRRNEANGTPKTYPHVKSHY